MFTDALLQLLWPSTFHGSQHEIIAFYGMVLFLHAVMNVFSVKLVALLNDISVWWYAAGSWAPATLAWRRDNRTRGFRVVDHYLNYGRTEQRLFDQAVTCSERERLFERG